MAQNHVAPLDVPYIKTAAPGLSNDVDLFPGIAGGWGLSFLINTRTRRPGARPAASRRRASRTPTTGSIGLTGLQRLPLAAATFYDKTAIDLFGKFETEVYRALS